MYRLFVVGFVFVVSTMAASPDFVPLFSKGVPGGKLNVGPEKDTTTPKDNLIAGRPVVRTGNVTEPSLAFYAAPAATNSGATVIVFPGGGYRILALDLEGTEICEWLNSIGVNAALVKYRVPEPDSVPRYQGPLQDAQRAVSYVRSHAEEWHLDAGKIGVLGFSAGGHLAALASTAFDKRTYDAQDKMDEASCRPDFEILIYPGYLAAGENLDTLPPEVIVKPDTPPAFLVQTEDDGVHVECSLVYYKALKNAKVPVEMHLFSNGGHGYGMRADPSKPVTGWPKLAEAWMKSRGIIHQ
jgi:acetyl esterase/lipase